MCVCVCVCVNLYNDGYSSSNKLVCEKLVILTSRQKDELGGVRGSGQGGVLGEGEGEEGRVH